MSRKDTLPELINHPGSSLRILSPGNYIACDEDVGNASGSFRQTNEETPTTKNMYYGRKL